MDLGTQVMKVCKDGSAFGVVMGTRFLWHDNTCRVYEFGTCMYFLYVGSMTVCRTGVGGCFESIYLHFSFIQAGGASAVAGIPSLRPRRHPPLDFLGGRVGSPPACHTRHTRFHCCSVTLDPSHLTCAPRTGTCSLCPTAPDDDDLRNCCRLSPSLPSPLIFRDRTRRDSWTRPPTRHSNLVVSSDSYTSTQRSSYKPRHTDINIL
ncbi:hypothetical protein VTJ04DRAFT_7806 [Mycothermus thermophilus]|uniref:uncharacterized protein n=1 Tax=Humicola insolens TaxID=85995 RepID=UPI003743260F